MDRAAGVTALHRAAHAGDAAECARLVAEGAPLDPRMTSIGHDPSAADPARRTFGGLGATPLVLAAERGHEDVVRLFLGAGADASAVAELEPATFRAPPRQETALHGAVRTCSALVVEALVAAGAPLDAGSCGTALHEAITVERADVARVLLRLGADPLARDAQGRTPFERTEPGPKGEPLRRLLREFS